MERNFIIPHWLQVRHSKRHLPSSLRLISSTVRSEENVKRRHHKPRLNGGTYFGLKAAEVLKWNGTHLRNWSPRLRTATGKSERRDTSIFSSHFPYLMEEKRLPGLLWKSHDTMWVAALGNRTVSDSKGFITVT